jgi:hypothetical protein
MTHLRSLWLSNNNLTQIPAQVSQLKHLKILGLAYNQLTELCPQLLELTKLEFLDVSSNQLLELPQQIDKFSNLHYLILNDNELVQLPMQIGNLDGLVELQVADNLLEKLPVTLGKLVHLKGNSFPSSPPGCIFTGNPLHYPPYEIVTNGSHQVLQFLQHEWSQLTASLQQQLLTGELLSNTYKLHVEYKDRNCFLECFVVTLAELKATIWRHLNIHCPCETAQLHCFDSVTDNWQEVCSLEDLQPYFRLRVSLPKGMEGSPLSCGSEFEEIFSQVNPVFAMDWKSLASRLGYGDTPFLEAWERTSNPARCVVHTWLSHSNKDRSIERLKEILEQFKLPNFASQQYIAKSAC